MPLLFNALLSTLLYPQSWSKNFTSELDGVNPITGK